MDHWLRLRAAQERRARAYVQWNAAFTSAIAAKSSPADFQAVAAVVMQELGAVSSEVRAVQALAGATAEVRAVVDSLQDAEKTRYEATVEVQRLLAVHTNSGVTHDPTCVALRTAPAGALRTGVGSSGLDASSSDDENEHACAHTHSHEHCESGPGVGCRKSNGCAKLAEDVELLRAQIREASAAVVDVVDEIQCHISA
uniref:Uncharacterized protein n=1 Tax=Neobodo designis TaxID=312471 RepID=A0A7S1KWY9_NEODS|mmetsp:Transcript_10423/g.32315  ORF Transcript_10423/g.32315 Transcript_10423/m.32315 type:complete len:199 (+) Transcript_10423:34-630(+)